jgi:hypothetical protein
MRLEGVYRQGKIELKDIPDNLPDETRVVISVVPQHGFPNSHPYLSEAIELTALGIDVFHAADIRARLQAFAEDWDSPAMDIYNQYDANKANLNAVYELKL